MAQHYMTNSALYKNHPDVIAHNEAEQWKSDTTAPDRHYMSGSPLYKNHPEILNYNK